MSQNKQTTVNLLPIAQAVKEDLAPVYGLKNILSAGLFLLNKLSDTEQKELIRQLNGNEYAAAIADENAAGRASSKSQRRRGESAQASKSG